MSSNVLIGGRGVDIANSYMSWGVKRSLREYVEGIHDGAIQWVAPATEQRFPCAAITNDVESQAMTFVADGSVNFYAHEGLMNIWMREITAITVDGTLQLYIGAKGVVRSVLIAEQNEIQTRVADTVLEITADALELTARGASILGGVYSRGTILDPIRLAIARHRLAPSALSITHANEGRGYV